MVCFLNVLVSRVIIVILVYQYKYAIDLQFTLLISFINDSEDRFYSLKRQRKDKLSPIFETSPFTDSL